MLALRCSQRRTRASAATPGAGALPSFLRGTEVRRKAPITSRQICWETAKTSPGKFTSVYFASERLNLGFTFMNLLSVAEKNFPQSEPDVAQDFFSLRKLFAGKTWKFTKSLSEN